MTWLKIVELLLRLLNFGVGALEEHKQNVENKKAQSERDAAEANPAKWFGQHFSNDNDKRVQSEENNQSPASDTSDINGNDLP